MRRMYATLNWKNDDRKNAMVAETLGIAHLDGRSVYIFPEKDVPSLIQAANTMVKNDHSLPPFTRLAFMGALKPSWMNYTFVTKSNTGISFRPLGCVIQLNSINKEHFPFHYVLFFATLYPFDCNARDNAGKVGDKE